MRRRRLLLGIIGVAPAAPGHAQYSSDAIRRRAEEQARQRDDWWARQQQLQAEERSRQEARRRHGDTSRQIERWEEQRERRLWGRTTP